MNGRRLSLFHFTSREVAQLLAAGGDFRGDVEGLVWLGEHPQHIDGASCKEVLCQVDFLEPLELARYRVEVNYESVDEIIPGESFTPKYWYYAIPSDMINSVARSVRCLAPKERKALMI